MAIFVLTSSFSFLFAVQINSKLPAVGQLVLTRLAVQLQRELRRNSRARCEPLLRLLGQLVNQGVASELCALQLLALLLDAPSRDSLELAALLATECGAHLAASHPRPFADVMEAFRAVLQEGKVDQRTQYVVEQFMEARRTKFAAFPALLPELDLVEAADQVRFFSRVSVCLSRSLTADSSRNRHGWRRRAAGRARLFG